MREGDSLLPLREPSSLNCPVLKPLLFLWWSFAIEFSERLPRDESKRTLVVVLDNDRELVLQWFDIGLLVIQIGLDINHSRDTGVKDGRVGGGER